MSDLTECEISGFHDFSGEDNFCTKCQCFIVNSKLVFSSKPTKIQDIKHFTDRPGDRFC
jgi:hypothetical protein